MRNRKTFYFSLGIVVCVCAGTVLLYAASRRGKPFYQNQLDGSAFRLRLSGYHESFPFALPGARYVLESASINREDWQQIIVYNADHPISFKEPQMRFVKDQIAYAYLNNYYAVTTDGGRKWFVWDIYKELPSEDLKHHNLWPGVQEIQMDPDGRGTMTLLPYLTDRERGPKLHTSDYGYHWLLEQR